MIHYPLLVLHLLIKIVDLFSVPQNGTSLSMEQVTIYYVVYNHKPRYLDYGIVPMDLEESYDIWPANANMI